MKRGSHESCRDAVDKVCEARIWTQALAFASGPWRKPFHPLHLQLLHMQCEDDNMHFHLPGQYSGITWPSMLSPGVKCCSVQNFIMAYSVQNLRNNSVKAPLWSGRDLTVSLQGTSARRVSLSVTMWRGGENLMLNALYHSSCSYLSPLYVT